MSRNNLSIINAGELLDIAGESEKTDAYQGWVNREIERRSKQGGDFRGISGVTYMLQKMLGTYTDDEEERPKLILPDWPYQSER
jgi:hypothetical protein